MGKHIHAVLLAGVSALATSTAYAQTAPQTSQGATGGSQASASSVDDIVVTGSRIISNGNNSPTPVTVLNAEEFLKLQPTSVTEAINLLPALQGSQNVTSRPAGGQRNGAGAYMNLRNMGSLRTLVLWDGMRVVPTINQNQADVDSSVVPQLLLERVDVVTGGVSAVYGSDAISGVINFVTDRDFNGVKLQANQGISTYGDNYIWDVGIAAGRPFANDRGHVEFSYQYHDDEGLQNRQDASSRSFLAANRGQAGTGTAANPYFNVLDMRLSNATFGGLIINTSVAADAAALRGLQFRPNGQLAAFNHGQVPIAGGTFAPFGSGGTVASQFVESGGDGAWFPSSSMKHGIQYHQGFGRFDYDLTDDLHFYAQGAYTKVFSFNQFRSPAFTNTTGPTSATGNGFFTFSYANPFLLNVQEPYRATFLNNPTRTFSMNEVFLNEPRSTQDTETYILSAGLEGVLGDYRWNIDVGQSQSEINAIDLFNIDRGKLAAALDAVDVGFVTTGVRNGQIACRAGQAYTGHAANAAYANCVPLNLFGGVPSQASLDYLYDETFNRNRTRQENVSGTITGSPFSTWAGPVDFALSGEWRRLRWDAVTNTDPLQLANCTGISFNCTATTARWFGNTMGAVPTVEQTVSEFALEALVPLLKDVPFARELNVSGAVRQTDYSTSGEATTWKVGVDWHVNDELRFRSTRSRDIRAPNLFDLFTSTQVNCAIAAVDPLTGFTFSPICNTQGSNPNLQPENADTFTIGGVFTPSFVPDFSFSLDYYNIDVTDVISLQQGWSPAVLQLCASTQGAAAACALIDRPSWTDTNRVTNPITATRSANVNIAAQHTWGVDAEAAYRFDLFGRSLNMRALIAYQPELIYDQGVGPSGVTEIAGAYNAGSNRLAASPEWKVTGVLNYAVTDSFNVTLLQRWRSELKATYNDAIVLVEPTLPAISYTTLNFSYSLDENRFGDAQVFLNIQNVFNTFPEVYYTGQVTQPGTQPFVPEGDDTIGRYFTLGFRLKL